MVILPVWTPPAVAANSRCFSGDPAAERAGQAHGRADDPLSGWFLASVLPRAPLWTSFSGF